MTTFKHNDMVVCKIDGKEITDARISIDKNGTPYICQNEKDGTMKIQIQDRYKFRCWNVLQNKMIYFNKLVRMDTENLMQNTGLKDKNGVEIYEGDIIQTDDDIIEVKQPEIFECDAFKVYGYRFCSNYFIDDYDILKLERFYYHNPIVIGNIYQNPELLK